MLKEDGVLTSTIPYQPTYIHIRMKTNRETVVDDNVLVLTDEVVVDESELLTRNSSNEEDSLTSNPKLSYT